jgi:hypothetical protein
VAFLIFTFPRRHAEKVAGLAVNRNIAILGQAVSARGLLEFCIVQSIPRSDSVDCTNTAGSRRLLAVARTLLALSALFLIASCSSPSTEGKSVSVQDRSTRDTSIQEKSIQKQYAAHTSARVHRAGGWQTHRPARALVSPQPPPDCELPEPEPDTVDADLWARLKLDYERHCYKQAEILARERLQRMLALGKCRIEPK